MTEQQQSNSGEKGRKNNEEYEIYNPYQTFNQRGFTQSASNSCRQRNECNNFLKAIMIEITI